ncbi:MAG: dihydrofolate reductase family protein [Proteobacteria bacterium]|nr:dihydrofolate reductase family protein [Pseudomonadota bacterium]MBU1387479.1 dihydrofolate reductase family protein [Pseudomonadota bacterium]MBU1541934.1 dihydrofolate reductase family protein [Pseudomonadota bacterium]MBU2429764.1 dihydrofolate reductase family protein [Pseudomonadota bacterium]MBU2481921.1 dihydrofolate reductase family protein [Pseudomonadota bacterium]
MDVILIMAMTADGKIARNSMELIDWTGKADKKYFVEKTKEIGVMIMGSKTFDTIAKILPGRKSIVMTRDKTRTSNHPDLVFTDKSAEEILMDLENQGFASAALIGGSMINSVFMEKQLIDYIHVTVVPRIFGKGLSLFDMSFDVTLDLEDTRIIEDGCIVLKYKVK